MKIIADELKDLTPAQMERLRDMIRSEQETSGEVIAADEKRAREMLTDYYRSLSEGSSQKSNDTQHREHWDEDLIRFSPFLRRKEGFSWISVYFEPERYPEAVEMARQAQSEMRKMIFRGIDFGKVEAVLDIGAGYASDLLYLGHLYPHLQLTGYNISPEQVRIGNDKARNSGMGERFMVVLGDSAKDEFPGQFDVILSFQVIHHIQDKQRALLNVSTHLKGGGYFLLVEIMSTLTHPIEAPESSAYFAPRETWANMLAAARLRIVEGVDAAAEISNFLYDPRFEEYLGGLVPAEDLNTRAHLRGPHQLGDLLGKGLATYAVLTIQKDPYLEEADLRRINRRELHRLIPYADVAWDEARSCPLLLDAWPERLATISCLRQEVLEAPAEQRHALVSERLCNLFAEVLGTEKSSFDTETELVSLVSLGFDSLSALDLGRRVESELGVHLSASLYYMARNIGELASLIVASLAVGEEAIDEQLLRAIEGMSEEEAEALLVEGAKPEKPA